MVAQGALNQIVASVFNRVRPDPKLAASAAASIASPRMSMSRSNSRMGYGNSGEVISNEHPPTVNGTTERQDQDGQNSEELSQDQTSGQEESRTSLETLKPGQEEEAVIPENTPIEASAKSADGSEDAEAQKDTPSITVDGTKDATPDTGKEEVSENVPSERASITL